jgi:DNA polymerase III delta prime subunit
MEEIVMSAVRQVPEKGERKILFLDEADGLTPNSQWMLRRMMEEYSNVTMFILACNNDAKIIDAIYDRCLEFYFNVLTPEELKAVAKNICSAEQRDVPPDSTLDELINASDGSARSFTNLLYQSIVGGVMPEISFNVTEYIKAVKNNDLETAKKLTAKTTFRELLREVLKALLRYGEKYEEPVRKLGDYFLLSPNPDENLGKIIVTLQLKKLLNGDS